MNLVVPIILNGMLVIGFNGNKIGKWKTNLNVKEVKVDVIIESINGYLLLDLAYSVSIAAINILEPSTFNFGYYEIHSKNAISSL